MVIRESNSLTFETRENDNRSTRDARVEPGKLGNDRLAPISSAKWFFGLSGVVAKVRIKGMTSSISWIDESSVAASSDSTIRPHHTNLEMESFSLRDERRCIL